MNITILGAGQVGGALGAAWAGKGHGVIYASRDPGSDKIKALVTAARGRARAAAIPEAVAAGDVVILTTPWKQTEDAIRRAGGLAGKIVMDCTNPLTMGADGLALEVGFTASAGEMVQRWAPRAKVVKAFNTIGFEHMGDAAFKGGRPAMFHCGDDAAAKAACAGLIEELGFEAIDCGPLREARLLEPVGMLWITLALKRGQGRKMAFGVLRK